MTNRRRPWLAVVISSAVAFLAFAWAAPAQARNPHLQACSNGYVSLSYDDGPTEMTPALLSALGRDGLRVTFFDVGTRAETFPSSVSAQTRAGHEVANHSYDHSNFVDIGAAAARAQLARTQTILSGLTGYTPRFFRPPYGATSPEIAVAAATLGLTQVIWTTDTNDWDGRSTDAIVSAALKVQPGGFVLMHDGYPNTLDAVPRIARGLASRGLCAGRIVHSDVPTVAWQNLSFPATVVAW